MAGCSIHRILVLFDWLVGFFSSLLFSLRLLFSAWEQTCRLPKTDLSSLCVWHVHQCPIPCVQPSSVGVWTGTSRVQTGRFWWPTPCQDNWCLAGALKSIRQYYGQSCVGNNQQKKTILCKKKFSSVTEKEMFLDAVLSGV